MKSRTKEEGEKKEVQTISSCHQNVEGSDPLLLGLSKRDLKRSGKGK